MKLKIKEIKIGPRVRQRLGNIQSLADSMKELGQLQPVLVTPLKTLISGQRRIEAAKRLGWVEIEAIETDTLLDAVLKLKAERDENSERMELAPSEMVEVAKSLKALLKPDAEKRSLANLNKGISRRVNVKPPGEQRGKQEKGQNIVADAFGISSSKLRQAEAVVDAAEKDPEFIPARDEMDETGNVNGAYRKVFPKDETGSLTLPEFKKALDTLEARIPTDCDHKKYGVPLNTASNRQMNWGKTGASASFYTR